MSTMVHGSVYREKSQGLNLQQVIRFHRRRVTHFLRAEYSYEDAKQDVIGILIEHLVKGQPIAPREVLKLLKSRPYGYASPEPLPQSHEVDFVAYVDELVATIEPQNKEPVKQSILGGKLISRHKLQSVSGLSEWKSRRVIAYIESRLSAVLPNLLAS